MKAKNLIKGFFLFILNFSFFSLPFLLVVYGAYGIFSCKILIIDVCELFINLYGYYILNLLIILGIVISIFSFLSNLFEKKLKTYFSISYSICILIFLVFALKFGNFEFEIKNFALNKSLSGNLTLSINFQFIFYLIIIGLVIDIIRKIIINFLIKEE